LGGTIMALVGNPNSQSVTIKASNTESVIIPRNSESFVPYAVLINGPGEFAGAIGPSGSKKAPVIRALFIGNVNSEAYDTGATSTNAFVVGNYVYCGGATNSLTGLYTTAGRLLSTNKSGAVGICTHVPTTSEPWLGVASLL